MPKGTFLHVPGELHGGTGGIPGRAGVIYGSIVGTPREFVDTYKGHGDFLGSVGDTSAPAGYIHGRIGEL